MAEPEETRRAWAPRRRSAAPRRAPDTGEDGRERRKGDRRRAGMRTLLLTAAALSTPDAAKVKAANPFSPHSPSITNTRPGGVAREQVGARQADGREMMKVGRADRRERGPPHFRAPVEGLHVATAILERVHQRVRRLDPVQHVQCAVEAPGMLRRGVEGDRDAAARADLRRRRRRRLPPRDRRGDTPSAIAATSGRRSARTGPMPDGTRASRAYVSRGENMRRSSDDMAAGTGG